MWVRTRGNKRNVGRRVSVNSTACTTGFSSTSCRCGVAAHMHTCTHAHVLRRTYGARRAFVHSRTQRTCAYLARFPRFREIGLARCANLIPTRPVCVNAATLPVIWLSSGFDLTPEIWTTSSFLRQPAKLQHGSHRIQQGRPASTHGHDPPKQPPCHTTMVVVIWQRHTPHHSKGNERLQCSFRVIEA